MERFRACFTELADPRSGNAQRHELDEIIMIALMSTLCGAETCVDMALFGRSKEPLLRRFLRLPGGIPSHRAPANARSDPRRGRGPMAAEGHLLAPVPAARSLGLRGLLRALRRGPGRAGRGRGGDRRQDRAPLLRPPQWPRTAAPDQRPVDVSRRRPLRGRIGRKRGRWACEQRLVLGQLRVDDKSNEIPAVPELLAMLALDGCIVTADAMHCQSETARAILDRGGDYVLALKANQPALHDEVRLLLGDPEAPPDDVATTTDGDHGRIEVRRADVHYDVAWLAEGQDFPGLKAVGKVTASREQDGRTTTSTRYYLLSRPLAAERFLAVVRSHWQIENALHWVLDVVMDEDQARARKDHAPENLARLRRFALNLLRVNRDPGSTRGKLKRAAWDDAFLLNILQAA